MYSIVCVCVHACVYVHACVCASRPLPLANLFGYTPCSMYICIMFALTEILLNVDYVDDQFVRIKSNQFGCPTEVDNQSVSLHCNATGYQEMISYKNGRLLDVRHCVQPDH